MKSALFSARFRNIVPFNRTYDNAFRIGKEINIKIQFMNCRVCNSEKLNLFYEHLPDSILAMNKISALLKEGGYGHFEFPNINSISHRIQRFLSKTKIHRRKYSTSYQPGHCNEFSRKAFCHLLKLTNYELVRWETYSNKPLINFIYNRIKIGTKARAIVRKI